MCAYLCWSFHLAALVYCDLHLWFQLDAIYLWISKKENPLTKKEKGQSPFPGSVRVRMGIGNDNNREFVSMQGRDCSALKLASQIMEINEQVSASTHHSSANHCCRSLTLGIKSCWYV